MGAERKNLLDGLLEVLKGKKISSTLETACADKRMREKKYMPENKCTRERK